MSDNPNPVEMALNRRDYLKCALYYGISAVSGPWYSPSHEQRQKRAMKFDERQLTFGPIHKDLDNNVNFSPDGRFLVFDCRTHETGIGQNRRLGKVDVHTGEVTIFYEQKPPISGVGAASFLNDKEVIVIHALDSGLPYDTTVRGGKIISADGSSRTRWLDSRDVTPPFTPGALRGGTHKHEPDFLDVWVGFTYNDHIMKTRNHSDLRNLGVSRHGFQVSVDSDPGNFIGESFSVLLTACVEHPRPGSDEYQRAEGDCWVGEDDRSGPPNSPGGWILHDRLRAFRGTVAVIDSGGTRMIGEVFTVTVPVDVWTPGPLGPLEGTLEDYPKPPQGATVSRRSFTAHNPDRELRGVTGHLRASGNGHWISCLRKARLAGKVTNQLFCLNVKTGELRQLSHLSGGAIDSLRFSPDSKYVAVCATDGSVYRCSAEEKTWGHAARLTAPNPRPADNIVISPDSRLIAYNRTIEGVQQIFVVPSG